MDIAQTGFFQYRSEENDIIFANYAFEMPSEWARGKKEHVMISVILDPLINPQKFKPVLEKFCEDVQDITDIYKAFYTESTRQDPEISIKNHELRGLFDKLTEKCTELLKDVFIGTILVFGLPRVGKTTVLRRLTTECIDPTFRPPFETRITKAFLENFNFEKITIGTHLQIQNAWKQRSFMNPSAIIFIISCDADTSALFDNIRSFKEIVSIFKVKEEHIPLLVLANKIDLNRDFSEEHAENILNLTQLNVPYHIALTSAFNTEGIMKGFRWLIMKLFNPDNPR